MTDFPEDMTVNVVDSLYEHYDLAYQKDDDVVHVYCDHCDDVVCVLDYDTIHPLDATELYELIIDQHRPI